MLQWSVFTDLYTPAQIFIHLFKFIVIDYTDSPPPLTVTSFISSHFHSEWREDEGPPVFEKFHFTFLLTVSFLSYFLTAVSPPISGPSFFLTLAIMHHNIVSHKILCQVIYLIKCDDMQMSWL